MSENSSSSRDHLIMDVKKNTNTLLTQISKKTLPKQFQSRTVSFQTQSSLFTEHAPDVREDSVSKFGNGSNTAASFRQELMPPAGMPSKTPLIPANILPNSLDSTVPKSSDFMIKSLSPSPLSSSSSFPLTTQKMWSVNFRSSDCNSKPQTLEKNVPSVNTEPASSGSSQSNTLPSKFDYAMPTNKAVQSSFDMLNFQNVNTTGDSSLVSAKMMPPDFTCSSIQFNVLQKKEESFANGSMQESFLKPNSPNPFPLSQNMPQSNVMPAQSLKQQNLNSQNSMFPNFLQENGIPQNLIYSSQLHSKYLMPQSLQQNCTQSLKLSQVILAKHPNSSIDFKQPVSVYNKQSSPQSNIYQRNFPVQPSSAYIHTPSTMDFSNIASINQSDTASGNASIDASTNSSISASTSTSTNVFMSAFVGASAGNASTGASTNPSIGASTHVFMSPSAGNASTGAFNQTGSNQAFTNASSVVSNAYFNPSSNQSCTQSSNPASIPSSIPGASMAQSQGSFGMVQDSCGINTQENPLVQLSFPFNMYDSRVQENFNSLVHVSRPNNYSQTYMQAKQNQPPGSLFYYPMDSNIPKTSCSGNFVQIPNYQNPLMGGNPSGPYRTVQYKIPNTYMKGTTGPSAMNTSSSSSNFACSNLSAPAAIPVLSGSPPFPPQFYSAYNKQYFSQPGGLTYAQMCVLPPATTPASFSSTQSPSPCLSGISDSIDSKFGIHKDNFFSSKRPPFLTNASFYPSSNYMLPMNKMAQSKTFGNIPTKFDSSFPLQYKHQVSSTNSRTPLPYKMLMCWDKESQTRTSLSSVHSDKRTYQEKIKILELNSDFRSSLSSCPNSKPLVFKHNITVTDSFHKLINVNLNASIAAKLFEDFLAFKNSILKNHDENEFKEPSSVPNASAVESGSTQTVCSKSTSLYSSSSCLKKSVAIKAVVASKAAPLASKNSQNQHVPLIIAVLQFLDGYSLSKCEMLSSRLRRIIHFECNFLWQYICLKDEEKPYLILRDASPPLSTYFKVQWLGRQSSILYQTYVERTAELEEKLNLQKSQNNLFSQCRKTSHISADIRSQTQALVCLVRQIQAVQRATPYSYISKLLQQPWALATVKCCQNLKPTKTI